MPFGRGSFLSLGRENLMEDMVTSSIISDPIIILAIRRIDPDQRGKFANWSAVMEQSNFHLLFLFCFLCFHSDVFESRDGIVTVIAGLSRKMVAVSSLT